MEEKKKKLPYEEPQIFLIDLGNLDIVTASGGGGGVVGGNDIEEDTGEYDGEWT